MKIAQKLLLTILVTCLVPLSVLGFAALAISQNALRDQIQARINNTAQHQLERLNVVNQRVSIELNNVEFKAQLRLLLQAYEQTPSQALEGNMNQALESVLQGADTFQVGYVTNRDGQVVAATDPSLIGHSEAPTAVFQAASKAATGNFFFQNDQGEIDQYLAVPLVLNAQFLGVAIVEATAEPYLVITKDYSELGLTGESYLMRQTANGQWQYLTPLRFDAKSVLTTTKRAPMSSTDYRGHRVLSAVRPISGTDWRLIVKIDTAEVEAPLVRIRNILALILAVTAGVAAVSAWYLSRFMTMPIKRITAVVTKIREGDLSLQVDIRSKDEIGLLGTAFNEMKTSLVETEARLKASIGSLPFGFAIIDNNGRLVFHNAALWRLVGRSIPDNERNSMQAFQEMSAGFSSVVDIHGRMNKARIDHTLLEENIELGPKFFRLLFVPVIDDTKSLDDVVGTVFIMEDTTDRRAMERSRDEFFSIASHELRTPLTAIRGNTSMILTYYPEPLKDPSLKEMITDVHDSSTRLIDIVNDFLDMSRLEQGRFVFKKEPCQIAEVIEQTLREFEVTGSQRKLYLKFEPSAATLPPVLVDRDRTRQILVNLLGNALKFTVEGGVTLTATRMSDSCIKVSVSDTGKGIPESSQHLLFRKFQQAADSILTRDNTQSTGLGLYISRMLAEGMGGKLYLEHTEPNKGTTFSLELPIADETNTVVKPQ